MSPNQHEIHIHISQKQMTVALLINPGNNKPVREQLLFHTYVAITQDVIYLTHEHTNKCEITTQKTLT
jgi:hypothetical protein